VSVRRLAADASLAVAALGTGFAVWLISTTPGFAGGSLAIALSGLSYIAVGALIARRRPDNPLPWVLVAIGLLASTGNAAQTLVDVAIHQHGADARPPVLVHWYTEWFWVPWIFLQFVVLPLLFPTGRVLSAAWRPVLKSAVAVIVVLTVMAMLQQELQLGTDDNPSGSLDNPFGLLPYRDLDDLIEVMLVPLAALTALAMSSLVLRFRRSAGAERGQMKVVVFAVMLGFVAMVVAAVIPNPQDFRGHEPVIFSLVPVAIGVAVLRYRLYDIDRLISRTVGYALVTLVLVSIYAGTVLVLGGTIRALTGQDSALVVAASTLAAAAAFRPVRIRVQRVVERRFNRTSYDAQQAVERFGSRLRTDLDLGGVTADMVAVANEVLRPAHVSLWIPGGGAERVQDR
jgi:hypothetical protein